ncbi:MFS transporter [Actinomadura sp. NBRC 104412]|uniref:MFS transporter n=1 Tax=Actinomadura sp. NBRC 104412 TaxID=3032203 RepID=UPI0024A337F9|nr:MFS transporter [Actinomadura sp. NBRC 104412]GLZ07800.1 MFS transporter [Actinomadura sp. NBRC 104412]
MAIPAPLRSGRFDLYWTGVVLTEIGTRGTFMANLFHMYQLTGSALRTGLIGLFQAVALIVLSPLGGAWADRVDRRRIVQLMQCFSLLVSLGLAVLTLAGAIQPALILVAVLLNTAAETFDRPARQAIIPALVPEKDLVKAFALINPSREIAILVGPALAGLLIAGFGPAGMYLADVATFLVLIVIMQVLRVPPLPGETRQVSVLTNIREGFAWLRQRSLILQLIGLDLVCTLFGAYRAVLPALATDVLHVGAAGFGLLAAAPALGALIGSALVFPLIDKVRSGVVVLGSTAAYGLMAIGLGQAPMVSLALVAATGLGLCDALHTTIRHAAVQIETPDAMRGRVTSTYQIASRGGPALGDLNIGGAAGLLGPAAALSLGGVVPIAVAAAVAVKGRLVRGYQVPAHESA